MNVLAHHGLIFFEHIGEHIIDVEGKKGFQISSDKSGNDFSDSFRIFPEYIYEAHVRMKHFKVVINNNHTRRKLLKHVVHHVGSALSHLLFPHCKLFRFFQCLFSLGKLPVCLPQRFYVFLLVPQVVGVAHLGHCKPFCDG